MLTFSVITLFPNEIQHYCAASIIGRAQKNQIIQVQTINPRDFTTDVHHKVDDAPYGGGVGMVMMCKPIMDAYRSLSPMAPNHRILMTAPQGKPLNQAMAKELAQAEQIVILCGHYEGIDARIMQLIPEIELVSLGDFVLTGGELAAMSIIDATTRLLPGALGKDASAEEESFTEGLLEYPHFTRPPIFEGLEVPSVLLSGNHAEIARWRREKSLELTYRYRPELLAEATLSEKDLAFLQALEAFQKA